MVKSPKNQKDLQQPSSSPSAENSSTSCKYTGVRKRKWGKYVSEIRFPNSRERIWLGSYDTAEKAARAFDAALFCLRGANAKFNFPNNPPDIPNGRSMTPAEIQVAAARFAHSDLGRVDNLDSHSDSLSSTELLQHVENSPCTSVSGGVFQLDNESTDIPLDNAFIDQFLSLGTESNNILDCGLYPGFDDLSGDYFMPPLPGVDNNNNNNNEDLSSPSSFLWNF